MWKSKFYYAFVLNRRVVLAIDVTPARWRGDVGSSPLDRARTAGSSPRNDLVKNCRAHPTHCLISTQVHAKKERDVRELREAPRAERPGAGAASFLMIRQFPEVAPRRALPGVLPRIPRYVT